MVQLITAISGLIALLIAAFGVIFGWWQVRIAREKLKHDLFDKRWHLYDRLCSITIIVGFREEWLTQDAFDDCLSLMLELDGLCRQARFLFSPNAQACFILQRINLESILAKHALESGMDYVRREAEISPESIEQLRSKTAQISLKLQDEVETYLVLGDFVK